MKIQNLKIAFSLLLAMGLFTIACKKDEDPPRVDTFTLSSLTADGIDLAGLTAAVDVPEAAVITATFSSEIDAATATKANFNITNAEGGAEADYSVSASGSTVTLTPTAGWEAGSQFNFVLSGSIAGANGVNYAGNSLSFRTAGIFVPLKENQVLYLSFDDQTATDAAGGLTTSTVGGLITYAEDRRGTPNAAAYFDGQGGIIEVAADPTLISPSTTISFWFNTAIADYDGGAATGHPQTRFVMGLGAEKGYFLEIGRRSNDPTADGFGEIFLKYATNQVNVGNNAAAVPKATAWSELNSQVAVNFEAGTASGWSFSLPELHADPPNRAYVAGQVMDKWTHLVMVLDATAQTKTFFVNGVKWATFQWIPSGTDWLFSDLSLKEKNNDGSAIPGIDGALALGFAGSSANTATGWATHATHLTNAPEQKKFFKGSLDQFRIFNVAMSDADVTLLYDNEK